MKHIEKVLYFDYSYLSPSKFNDLNRIFFFIVTGALILTQQNTYGQFIAHQSNNIPVIHDNNTLTNAWAGGINAGQISTIDVNQDGLEDVFIFDRSARKVMVFLNNGSDDPNTFEYSYEYSNSFPFLRNWALLRDYNCDGKKDIFTYNGVGGFKVYKNTSSAQLGLQFELIEESLQSYFEFQFSQYFTQIYISSIDIPVVDDLDGDGDLDVIVMSLSGVMLEYHKNYSVEETGTCDSLMIRAKNRCYGYFSESAFDNTISLHDEETHNNICPPGFNFANPGPTNPRPDDEIDQAPHEGGARHEGTTILTLDLNQELPKEIILGDIGNSNLVSLTNSTTSSAMDSIVAYDTEFPANNSNTEAVDLIAFPASFYEDMNNDNVRDLIVCPNDEYASSNYNSVWYYRNNGEDDLPQFELEQKDLFQKDMIEVGEGAAAFFFDYNQDGLIDMLVGNKGYFISPGVYQSRLSLYENTGTTTHPAFTLISDDFANIGQLNLGQGLHPTFGDLDGDGDIDMLVGTSSGRVYVFYNTAGQGNTVDLEISSQPILKDVFGEDVDPGQFSTPQLIDLDRDGRTDLVMGERNGQIFYYQNVGTESSPEYELVNDFLGEIETAEGFSTTGYSVIRFFEIENQYHLLVGSETGKIRWYSNIDGNLNGAFSLENDQAFGIQNGIRSTVNVIDINNDGHLDLFAGNFAGGILFFEGGEPTSVNVTSGKNSVVHVFPNPATSEITIRIQQYSGAVDVSIFNAVGQCVHQETSYSPQQTLSISHLEGGIYFISVSAGTAPLGVVKLVVRR